MFPSRREFRADVYTLDSKQRAVWKPCLGKGFDGPQAEDEMQVDRLSLRF